MCPSSSTWSAAPILLKIWPLRSSSACSAWFQAGTLLPPCAICVPGLPGIGSTTGWPPCPARPGWLWLAAARFPTQGSTRSSWAQTARDWVSSTRSSCLSGVSARPSPWVTTPGGSRRSRPTAWSSGRPRGIRRSCHSGEGKTRLAPRSWELRWGPSAGRLPAGLTTPNCPAGSRRIAALEARATEPLIRYIARQARIAGVVPDDQTILVETFRDPAGELGLAVLSPFGGKIHQGLKLALLGRIRDRLGIQASCLHGDDGLLIRLPGMDDPPLDLLEGLTADEAERLIRLELPQTALYGLRFRQNAARALLMPRPDPGKRTPLWLQRLRAKDLLQVVGKLPDFPIVVETFRECLDQDLELPRLRRLLDAIGTGSVRLVTRQGEIASPFASELIFQFTPTYLYEWDEPRCADLRAGGPAVDEDLLDALLESPQGARLLDPQALGRVESRLRRRGTGPANR